MRKSAGGYAVGQVTEKITSVVILAQELRAALCIRKNGKAFASGSAGMYLCRDIAGCLWFESPENIHKYYQFLTASCGLFLECDVRIRKYHQSFLIKRGNIPILVGETEDILVSYPSGIYYLVRKKAGGKDILLPINLDGSKKVAIDICL